MFLRTITALLFFITAVGCQTQDPSLDSSHPAMRSDPQENPFNPRLVAQTQSTGASVNFDSVFDMPAAASEKPWLPSKVNAESETDEKNDQEIRLAFNLPLAVRISEATWNGSTSDLRINLPDGTRTVVTLSKSPDVHSKDFTFLERDTAGTIVSRSLPRTEFYQGRGLKGERVVGSFNDGEFFAYIRSIRGKTYEIHTIPEALRSKLTSATNMIVFETADEALREAGERYFTCPLDNVPSALPSSGSLAPTFSPASPSPSSSGAVSMLGLSTTSSGGSGTSSSLLPGGSPRARVAIHADMHVIARSNNNALTAARNMERLFFFLREIFIQDIGLDLELEALFIDSTDPFAQFAPQRDVQNILNAFVGIWRGNATLNQINRNFTLFYSGLNYSNNTVAGATTYGGICANFGGNLEGAYSVNSFFGAPSPHASGFSPEFAAVAAHEMGHNFNQAHCSGVPNCQLMNTTLSPINPYTTFGPYTAPAMVQVLSALPQNCLNWDGNTSSQPIAYPIIENFALASTIDSTVWNYHHNVTLGMMPGGLGQALLFEAPMGGSVQMPSALFTQPTMGPGPEPSRMQFVFDVANVTGGLNEMSFSGVMGASESVIQSLSLQTFAPVFRLHEWIGSINSYNGYKFRNIQPPLTSGASVAGLRNVRIFERNNTLFRRISTGAAPRALATLGDVNGDGFDDFAIGYPEASPPYVDIVSGASRSTLQILQGAPGTEMGYAVTSLQDLNRDGYDDVLIGAPGANQALLYHGSPSGLQYQSFFQGGAGDRFGETVSWLGKFNNDQYPEFAVGAPQGFDPGRNIRPGYVHVYDGASRLTQFIHYGTSAGDGFGSAIAAVNAEWTTTVAVGAPNATATNPYVKFLNLFGQGSTPLYSTQPGNHFGQAIAVVRGFVSGVSGYHVAVGSDQGLKVYEYNSRQVIFSPTNTDVGKSLEFLSDWNDDFRPELLANTTVFRSDQSMNYIGSAANVILQAGCNVFVRTARAGDIDGDGYDDYLILHRNASNTQHCVQVLANNQRRLGMPESSAGVGGRLWYEGGYAPKLTFHGFLQDSSQNTLRLTGAPHGLVFPNATCAINLGFVVATGPVARSFGIKAGVVPVASLPCSVATDGSYSTTFNFQTVPPGFRFYAQAVVYNPPYYNFYFSNVVEIEAQ